MDAARSARGHGCPLADPSPQTGAGRFFRTAEACERVVVGRCRRQHATHGSHAAKHAEWKQEKPSPGSATAGNTGRTLLKPAPNGSGFYSMLLASTTPGGFGVYGVRKGLHPNQFENLTSVDRSRLIVGPVVAGLARHTGGPCDNPSY